MSKPRRTGNFDIGNLVFHTLDEANRGTAEASLEFGRFRVPLRQRLLLADDTPMELGMRALELLVPAGGKRIAGQQRRALFRLRRDHADIAALVLRLPETPRSGELR